MSCNRWQREIEESFGEPDTVLEAHLATCDDCRALAADQRRLRTAAAALPRSVEPPRDLWPGIAARLEAPRVAASAPPAVPPRWRWSSAALRLAAAVLLVLAGGILSRWLLGPAQPPAGAGGSERGAAATQLASTPSLAAAIDDYRAAKTALEAAIAARRAELSDHGPDVLSQSAEAVIERNLAIIDRAIVELETALSEDPGNPGLETLLLARYQQEIELLRRLSVGSRS